MTNSFSSLTKAASIALVTLFISACGSSEHSQSTQMDLTKHYPAESGGTLISAMTGEPSGLISMIAGESASSAISSNIFNTLLKYDKNLELEGDLSTL